MLACWRVGVWRCTVGVAWLVWRRYYLFCHEGWDVKRLSQRFGVRSERVAVILNMKRTEEDMKATGRYDDRVDELFSKMYSGRFDAFVEKGLSNDQGINLAVLKDEQVCTVASTTPPTPHPLAVHPLLCPTEK